MSNGKCSHDNKFSVCMKEITYISFTLQRERETPIDTLISLVEMTLEGGNLPRRLSTQSSVVVRPVL